MGYQFFKLFHVAMPKKLLTETIGQFDADAEFDGPQRAVFLRVGTDSTGDVTDVYVDLCNDNWEVVHITTGGWKVVSDAPVRFIRKEGMLPLPVPEEDRKALRNLDDFLAHLDDDGRVLCKGFLRKVGASTVGRTNLSASSGFTGDPSLLTLAKRFCMLRGTTGNNNSTISSTRRRRTEPFSIRKAVSFQTKPCRPMA
jgi:hypothetical protein